MAACENEENRLERLHIGTMGWSYKFWVGNFYPDGLKPIEFLKEYSKHFNSVELDSTFYRIPSASTIEAWKNQTPEGFMFSAKFPGLITHIKRLQNCERDAERFLSSMSELQSRLGPLLLQFPISFGPNYLSLLEHFLSSLPRGYRYAVEVRNKKLIGDQLYSILRENNAALVLAAQPNTAPTEEATADFHYIRWEGNRREITGTQGKIESDRTKDIEKWADRIERLMTQKKEIFGYFSKYYSGHPPSDAEQLLKLVAKN